MSLKAKIEAVIYASEEPVTLAQLAGLLSHEAQSELDALDARQHELDLNPEGETPEPEVPEAELPLETAPDLTPDEQAESEAQPELQVEPAADGATPEPSAAKLKDEARRKERRLREYFRQILDQLIADFAAESNDRGIEIREVAGGFRMATKPEYHDAVRGFVKSLKPPLKLSLQALETLAVVAYKQPITAPEVSEIRGVDSSGVLGSLMTRKLISTAGRKQVIGRPILYKTTKDFLLRFGLKDVQELPSIEEFEKMAGELADVEPIQKEIPMAEVETEREEELRTAAEVEEEKAAVEPQADGDNREIDGRISPPAGYKSEDADDPSGADAEIQDAEIQDADIEESEMAAKPTAPAATVVATPEGDNEFAPDEPLAPLPDDVQKTPQIDTNKL